MVVPSGGPAIPESAPHAEASHAAAGRGRRPRVALAHDWLVGFRGGEAVVERLARVIAHRADLAAVYTMFADGRPVAPAIDALPRRVSAIGRLPAASGPLRRWLLPAYPAAVMNLSRTLARDHRRRPIDLVVSTSSAAIKGLAAPPGVPHLCYCHAPPRYLWSRRGEYRGSGPLDALRSAGLALAWRPLRAWDRASTARAHHLIANSSHTAREIETFYGRSARVVHPPVRTDYFTIDGSVRREGFWLVAGALEPYKRTDRAIEAARLAGAELIIAGTGSDLPRLRALAARPADDAPHATGSPAPRGRVTFLGRVDDHTLRHLYRTARLLVYPQIEDFGIVAVEAQACGCPVLARSAGGALDTVIPGVTGVLCPTDDPAELARLARDVPADPSACRRSAERFTEAEFDRVMGEIIDALLAEAGFIPPTPATPDADSDN